MVMLISMAVTEHQGSKLRTEATRNLTNNMMNDRANRPKTNKKSVQAVS